MEDTVKLEVGLLTMSETEKNWVVLIYNYATSVRIVLGPYTRLGAKRISNKYAKAAGQRAAGMYQMRKAKKGGYL